jgi:hypothetical protein
MERMREALGDERGAVSGIIRSRGEDRGTVMIGPERRNLLRNLRGMRCRAGKRSWPTIIT